MSMSAMAARAAALLLTSEKGRKGICFLLVAIFAPVILIAAILCSNTAGGAEHNNSAVEASFYGVTYSEDVPDEFRTHIADMQTAFTLLDSAVAEANATMTDGKGLSQNDFLKSFETASLFSASQEESDQLYPKTARKT